MRLTLRDCRADNQHIDPDGMFYQTTVEPTVKVPPDHRRPLPFERHFVDDAGRRAIEFIHDSWSFFELKAYAAERWIEVFTRVNTLEDREKGADTKRRKADQLLAAIEEIRSNRRLSWEAACRVHLAQHDKQWTKYSAEKQAVKVKNLERRVREARKRKNNGD